MKKSYILTLLTAILFLVGCDDSDTTTPTPTTTTTEINIITLDAVSAKAYVDFGGNTTSSSATSTWQVAYQKFSGFSTNSGTSGNGNVSACLHYQYDNLYMPGANAFLPSTPLENEFMNINGTNTEEVFDNVTANNSITGTSCITANTTTKTSVTAFETDGVNPHIELSDWLASMAVNGNPAKRAFSASTSTNNGWILRTTEQNFVRFKVKTANIVLASSGNTPIREVVLESEKWNTNTVSFETATTSVALDFTTTPQHYDFESNSVVNKDTTNTWDIVIQVIGQDYPIYLNSPPYSDGKAAIGTEVSENAFMVKNPTLASQVAQYVIDSASGAFDGPGDYGPLEYGIGVGNHQLWPTFAIYIVKDEVSTTETNYYKVQVISNTGEQGNEASGNIVIRYKKLN